MTQKAANQKDIQNAYNKAAKTYLKTATIYQEIGKRLLSRLDYIHCQPEVILDAGCGPGYFCDTLAKRYPQAEIIALDFSEQMIQSALNLKIVADVRHIPLPAASVDFIFSNQLIQDIADTSTLFKEFYRVLKPEGLLLFSTLGPDTLKELSKAWRSVDTYGHINQHKDLHTLGDELLAQQFIQPVVDMEIITVNYPNPKTLLDDLKAQGSYNAHPLRRRGLMGKDALDYLFTALEQQRQSKGKIPLTYEVIYGHAWRGETRSMHNPATGETFITLDQIKKI